MEDRDHSAGGLEPVPTPPEADPGQSTSRTPRMGMAVAVLFSIVLALGLRLVVSRSGRESEPEPNLSRRPQLKETAPIRPAAMKPEPQLGPPDKPAARPSEADPEAVTQDLLAALERWRLAWEGRDLEAYLGLYSPSFGAQGKALEDWRKGKQPVFADPKPISVELSDVTLELKQHIALVRFRQHYRRDVYEDIGIKTLYFRQEPGGWRIFNEEWRPLE